MTLRCYGGKFNLTTILSTGETRELTSRGGASSKVSLRNIGTAGTGISLETSTASKQTTGRSRVYIMDANAPTIQFKFVNFYGHFTLGEPGSGGTMQPFFTVITSYGQVIPITFNGEQSLIVANGGECISDPIPNPARYDGDWVYCDPYAIFSTGILFASNLVIPLGEGLEFGVTVPDKRGLGTIGNDGVHNAIRPVSVLGMSSKPSVACIGTSRTAGQGDTITALLPAKTNNIGIAARSLGGRMACGNFGVPSARASTDVTGTNYAKRAAIINSDYTHVNLEHGINDIVAGRTAAQLYADNQNMAAKFQLPVTFMTLDPVATSTNAFIDEANQTTNASNPERVNYNNILRTSSLFNVIDTTQVTEKTLNSGKWTPYNGQAITGDGVHHNNLGYTLIQNSGLIHPGLFV
jgi:hypothetical protein